MLDRTTSQTTAAGQEPGRIKTAPRPIDHRRVKRKRFGVVNPTFAALAAFQVHTGEVSATSRSETRRVCSVSPSEICILSGWHRPPSSLP